MVSSKATVAKALGKRTSVLDIGCGNAERLTQLAKKHPKRRFAGLEWKKQKRSPNKTK